jgi:hypothetical protein
LHIGPHFIHFGFIRPTDNHFHIAGDKAAMWIPDNYELKI